MELKSTSFWEEQREYSPSKTSTFPSHVKSFTADYRSTNGNDVTPTVEFRLNKFEGSLVTVCIHHGDGTISNSYSVVGPASTFDDLAEFLGQHLPSMRVWLDSIAAYHFNLRRDTRYIPRPQAEARAIAHLPVTMLEVEPRPITEQEPMPNRGTDVRARKRRARREALLGEGESHADQV